VITATALPVAGLLGACGATTGSSGNGGSTAGGSRSDVGIPAEAVAEFDTAWELAQCMRDHGVERFPDPQISESGLMLVGVPWSRDAAEWNRARRACQRGEPFTRQGARGTPGP
jgi:hypothetical protein